MFQLYNGPRVADASTNAVGDDTPSVFLIRPFRSTNMAGQQIGAFRILEQPSLAPISAAYAFHRLRVFFNLFLRRSDQYYIADCTIRVTLGVTDGALFLTPTFRDTWRAVRKFVNEDTRLDNGVIRPYRNNDCPRATPSSGWRPSTYGSCQTLTTLARLLTLREV